EVEGMLGSIVYIDLVDLDEVRARETLLAGVQQERGKPKTAPEFPDTGEHTIPEPQRFPGNLPPLWNVPYRRTAYFTGREDILKRLSDALRTSKLTVLTQPQAISGLGGIVRHEATGVIVSCNKEVTRKPAVPPAVSLNGKAGRQQPVRSPLTTTFNREVGSQTVRRDCYL